MLPNFLTNQLIRVLRTPKDAATVGEWPTDPVLFIPVTWGTLPYLYGIAQLVIDETFFEGDDATIQQALNTLEEQMSEPPITIEQVIERWGAQYQTSGGTLETQQGEEYPIPFWEFQTTRDESGALVLEFRHDESR